MDESSGKTKALGHLPWFLCSNHLKGTQAFILMQSEKLMLQSQRYLKSMLSNVRKCLCKNSTFSNQN